jgi:hypothetical protein
VGIRASEKDHEGKTHLKACNQDCHFWLGALQAHCIALASRNHALNRVSGLHYSSHCLREGDVHLEFTARQGQQTTVALLQHHAHIGTQ